MLQDIPTPALREARSCVLETERLTLRRPTLADVKAIARLANDRRIAENTRRLPHPYLQEHAVEFVRATADGRRDSISDRKQLYADRHGRHRLARATMRLNSAIGSASNIGARALAPRPRARRSTSSSRSSMPITCSPAPASPTRRRATFWRNAASSGAASSCTDSRRWDPRPRSIASACPAASGRR